MEKIFCMCISAIVLLALGYWVFKLAKNFVHVAIVFEREGKKGGKTVFRFNGKQKSKG